VVPEAGARLKSGVSYSNTMREECWHTHRTGIARLQRNRDLVHEKYVITRLNQNKLFKSLSNHARLLQHLAVDFKLRPELPVEFLDSAFHVLGIMRPTGAGHSIASA
jgi:hypothetical protein